MKFKFDFIRTAISLFLALVVCVAVYQLYSYFYTSVATEYAVEISCEETVNVTGYFVRNEFVIDSGNSKYIDLTISNGGKVARNGTIANVYSTENAAKTQTEIRKLQDSIDEFKTVIAASAGYSNYVSYTQEIRSGAISVVRDIVENSPTDSFENASNFITSVTKEKISNGEISDYSEKLALLENRMAELKSQSSAVTSYITSPESGYFSYKVDGLESRMDMTMTEDFSAQAFENIVSLCGAEASSSGIGKVVKGSEWRVCFKSDADKFETVNVGDTLYIRIPSVTDSKIKCSVVEVCVQDENVYIVLESNMVSGDLLSQRVCEIDIIVDSYNGLRIDKNAIRKVNGEDGVYISVNGIIKYRKVELLYIGSTYAVVKYDVTNSNGLQAYDEVVVKGTDIYEEKVVS